MSLFRFKQFSIKNEASAMKVNTDGVLLGTAVSLEGPVRHVLDVGTGTGTIALILAQRLQEAHPDGAWQILGIDIDAPSAREAAENFAASPWSSHLRSEHLSLSALEKLIQSGASGPDPFPVPDVFDLIVSNPPYFESSLQIPDAREAAARHAATADNAFPDAPLSFRTLLDFAQRYLSPAGRLALILPSDRETDLLRHARMRELYPERITSVKTVLRKPPSRIIAEFSPRRTAALPGAAPSLTAKKEIVIREDNDFSAEYRQLVKDFYLWG